MSSLTMLTIQPDGKIIKKIFENSCPSHIDIHDAIEGHFQLVPYFDTILYDGKKTCVAFCHDEGKLIGKPFNYLAQTLWIKCNLEVANSDYLVGNIVIIFGDRELMRQLWYNKSLDFNEWSDYLCLNNEKCKEITRW